MRSQSQLSDLPFLWRGEVGLFCFVVLTEAIKDREGGKIYTGPFECIIIYMKGDTLTSFTVEERHFYISVSIQVLRDVF